jgi:uncharacterized protein (DUF58 family)
MAAISRTVSVDPRTETGAELLDESFLRRLHALSLVARRTPFGAAGGLRRAHGRGPGSEFADYREYSSGDDYRHVDWKAYARSERLLVRQHVPEVELAVYLLLDCSASMASGEPAKLDHARTLTAALAYLGLARFDRVTIHPIRDRLAGSFVPQRGPQALRGVSSFLRTLEASGPTDLARSARELCARSRRAGLVILLSDLYDPSGVVSALDLLRQARFETSLVRIVDSSELAPRSLGELELVDAESGRTRSLSVTPELIEAYGVARRRETEALARACAERAVPLHLVDTRVRPEDALLGLLRRGGLVR